MNKRMSWKIVLIPVCLVLCIAAANTVASGEEKEIPEYIGSQACLGCHAEKYVVWKSSDHAHMLSKIINSTELPLELDKAPADLQSELRKAEYIVAGRMFIARDPATEHYKFLRAAYNSDKKAYMVPKMNLDWSTECAGCHVTNMDTPNLTWTEDGIGCEACHGPGRDHALGDGDAGKIVTSKESDICGQCHGGNDRSTGAKLMSDGTKWIVGFRPGMKLSQMEGVQLTPVDPTKIPPDSRFSGSHLRNYNMWEASGHAGAINRIINNERVSAECYGCHSAEGFRAKLQGKTVDMNKKDGFNSLTCVACHDPHHSDHPHQLVADSQKVCTTCHMQEGIIKGQRASGVEDTVSDHSEIECVECHMTQANHLMKVIRPDDPDLAEDRKDSCTLCHTDSDKKSRAEALQEWQSTFSNRMDALQADLHSITASAQSDPGLLVGDLKAKFDNVESNLRLLVKDGSKGAHNYEYAIKIMDQAGEDLDAVKAAIK